MEFDSCVNGVRVNREGVNEWIGLMDGVWLMVVVAGMVVGLFSSLLSTSTLPS